VRRGARQRQTEYRFDDPFTAIIAMTLVRKFDQDCDQLTVFKQQDSIVIGTVGFYPQSVG
jgi:hypothetical protein